LPSLATVVDLFRPEPGKNLDCRNELLLSDFIEPSFFSPLLPRLFIRKKFLSFCGKGLWPFACLLGVIEMPEKLRFSLGGEFEEKLWNTVVIEDDMQHSRKLLLVIEFECQ
jgi:hypothetical protein